MRTDPAAPSASRAPLVTSWYTRARLTPSRRAASATVTVFSAAASPAPPSSAPTRAHSEVNSRAGSSDCSKSLFNAGGVLELASEGTPDDGAADQTALTVPEAARRLGISRARVYQLLASGTLDDAGTASLRIDAASVARRTVLSPPVGAQLAPLSAWAILALASADAAVLRHVAGLLSDPDRSRARARLQRHGLLELRPRFRGRAIKRGFVVRAVPLVDLLADPRLVFGGSSAVGLLGAAQRDLAGRCLRRRVSARRPGGAVRCCVQSRSRGHFRPTPVWSRL